MKQAVRDSIERKKELILSICDRIFDSPELMYLEHTSSAILADALENEGFAVQRNTAGIQTAFTARFGSGKPVIGILAEYDAVSGLSQVPGAFEPKPIHEGSPGHGCGHNLLSGGSLAAAIAIKDYLERSHRPGTVILFGCPAEEGGSGKVFLARHGAFDELDCALTWHPGDFIGVAYDSSLANILASFRFNGVASHAALTPHLGRSALDAVELMNIGVQFLREHILPDARVHYAITDAGGRSPNVVQPLAEVLYQIRAPRIDQVREIYARVCDIASGAALMSGTSVEVNFRKASSDIILNRTLALVLQRNLQYADLPSYSAEEIESAARIRRTIKDYDDSLERYAQRLDQPGREYITARRGRPINDFVTPLLPNQSIMSASSDVGDVSWICPTAQITACTMAACTSYHSWQLTAQGKSSIAHKGALFAGNVLALTAIELIETPSLIERAKAELLERLEGQPYVCPIPKAVQHTALIPR
ncbi:MAG: amidohydrolase [Bacillota bacterium]